MCKNFLLNEEKGTVICFLDVDRKLDKDAERYSINRYDFPTTVIGVAKLRGEDKFDAEIGRRVAAAKAEKEYLNSILNREYGLRQFFEYSAYNVSLCDELLADLYKKRLGFLKALERLIVTNYDKPEIEYYIDKEKGIITAAGKPNDFWPEKLATRVKFILDYEYNGECVYSTIKGTAKLNKDTDEFKEDIGCSVAYYKLNLQAIGRAIHYVKIRREYWLKRGMQLQQNINHVLKRRENVLDNLKSF